MKQSQELTHAVAREKWKLGRDGETMESLKDPLPPVKRKTGIQ